MAKCPKCESTKFKVEKVESPTTAAFIICDECKTLISVLENINFNNWYDKMFKNHGYFENQINILKSELSTLSKKVKDQNEYIIDLLERIDYKVKK